MKLLIIAFFSSHFSSALTDSKYWNRG